MMMLRRTLSVMSQHRTGIHTPVRQMRLTRVELNSDGDDHIKNDPDVKKWMNEIKKDFDPKTKPKTVVDHPKEETTSLSSTKNVSQLLSELYGEADNKASSNEKFSSVGECVQKY